MTEESRPYLSKYQDRHDKTRWRYRRVGKTISIPGEPGSPDFEEAYQAAIEGREPRKAIVVAHPGASLPKSFRDAWKRVQKSPEWLAYGPRTKAQATFLTERFLQMTVVDDVADVWADQLVSDLRRRHLKDILARFSEMPHSGRITLTAIRRMIKIALDEEWVEIDVSSSITYRPAYVGHRAWSDDEMQKFEERWPAGSAARTAYALALWLGNRRSDIAVIEWKQFDFARGVVRLDTVKGGKHLVLPITTMLAEALEPVKRAGDTVLVTAYGKPFSENSLTGLMADWTKRAGIGKGATLHGLRKTLGKMMAEASASTRELMDVLGHTNIAHAELYSREAAQELLAREAMEKVTRLVAKKRGG